MSFTANMWKHSVNHFLVGLEQSRRIDSSDRVNIIGYPKKRDQMFLTIFSDHKWVILMGCLNRFEPSISRPQVKQALGPALTEGGF